MKRAFTFYLSFSDKIEELQRNDRYAKRIWILELIFFLLRGSNFWIILKDEEVVMRDLSEIRMDIDRIDKQIVELFEERMALTRQVAEFKIANNKPVLDAAREAQKLDAVASFAKDPENAQGARELFEAMMAISRAQQQKLIDGQK